MRTVRIWYQKLGRARFISHLDINRCMSRAVRRAGLPLWYTEGFNPHPYLTFALPLSLGIESLYESMDIRIEGDMEDRELVERMNAVMPEGIAIIGAAEPKHKAKEIAFARYRMTFGSEEPVKTARRLEAVLRSGNLSAEKRGKQGRKKVMKEVTLAEFIENSSCMVQDGAAVLELLLCAGVNKNVSPSLLAKTLQEKAGHVGEVSIVRERLLLENKEPFC